MSIQKSSVKETFFRRHANVFTMDIHMMKNTYDYTHTRRTGYVYVYILC